MRPMLETTPPEGDIRHDWTREDAQALLALPFADLIYRAQDVHRRHFDANRVEVATLLSVKTGGCPEDCAYCPQSAHHDTGVANAPLKAQDEVLAAARAARQSGATRFCMGAAWRSPHDRDMGAVCDMVAGVKALGLETCMTLGMLNDQQAARLADAGLDFYNHNIDTSESFYGEIITTRDYADRLETLDRVREAGISVCCGGIVGLGESAADRADMLVTLATMETHPESVPVNMLIRAPGTPLADAGEFDALELVRTIAAARIMMPASVVRLSAGRTEMDEATQALCYLAGANSIFLGDRLLTTDNPAPDADRALFDRLGIAPATPRG